MFSLEAMIAKYGAKSLNQQRPVTLTRKVHTLVNQLKRCSTHKQLESLYAFMVKTSENQDCFFINQFISACSSIYHSSLSLFAFTQIHKPNAFVYNATIKGFVHCNYPIQALLFYRDMLRANVMPTSYTFSSVVKACSLVSMCGEAVHVHVRKLGFDSHLHVQTSLIDFYSNLGRIVESRKMFDEMSERDVFSWTTMVSGYARVGDLSSARRMFEMMPEKNTATWNTLIDGYARTGDIEAVEVLFKQMPVKDIISWTTMINCYSQNKQFMAALSVFDEMKRNNVNPDQVTMATVISACAHLGGLDLGKEAFGLNYAIFSIMGKRTNNRANSSSSKKRAAGQKHSQVLINEQSTEEFISDKNVECEEIEIEEKDEPEVEEIATVAVEMEQERDEVVAVAGPSQSPPMEQNDGWNLVRGKNSVTTRSQQDVNDEIHSTSIAGFNKEVGTPIHTNNSFVLEGHVGCLEQAPKPPFVIGVNQRPKRLVEEGRKIFKCMSLDYCISPEVEHYGCIIDLLSKAGDIKEALDLIKSMEFEPNSVIWGSLLSGCKLHRNLEIARMAVDQLTVLEPYNSGYYTLLINMNAEVNRWGEVAKIRTIMKELGIEKMCPGSSWIEMEGKIHQFAASDTSRLGSNEIYSFLTELNGQMKLAGCIPEYASML
ncbi:hypothetical protein ACFE04_008398 [Oxalis oulophora]